MPEKRIWRVLAIFEGKSALRYTIDEENEAIVLRMNNGPSWAMSLLRFNEINQHIGDPCLVCPDGFLEDLYIEDLLNPKLSCGTCKTLYSVHFGEIHIHDLNDTPSHLRRQSGMRRFLRRRNARLRRS